MKLRFRVPQQALDGLEVRLRQGAVPRDVGVHESAHALLSHHSYEVGGNDPTLSSPAVDRDVALAGVHRYDERVGAELRDHLSNESRVFHRGRPNDDPVHARGCQRLGRLECPNAASNLHGHSDGGNEGLDGGPVSLSPFSRAVQVDDVDPRGAQPQPTALLLRRDLQRTPSRCCSRPAASGRTCRP